MKALEFSHEKSINNHFVIYYKCETIIILLLFYFIDFLIKYGDNEFIEKRNINFGAINLSYINNLKKLVYTVNLGHYDTIKKIPKQIGYDYFLFTDLNKSDFNDTNWTIISIPKIVENLNVSIIKKQRFIKTHPHLFFPNYDISIYIDGIYTVDGDLNEFLLRILTLPLNIYTLEHPCRNSIRQEFLAVKRLKKENKSNIIRLRNRYNKNKFSDRNGLIESCLIIRKHNDKNCINIMEEWFDEIKKYSHRDQLTFNYIIWKKKIKIKYLPKNLFFQYFSQAGVHKKKLIFKRQ